jgi:hypothetical protein
MFLAVPKADSYRWIGRSSETDGRSLSKVRFDQVLPSWQKLSVGWVKETQERPPCDFPIFHPVVRACSLRAAEVLRNLAGDSIEFLPLKGLLGQYVGFHCTRWLDALAPDQGPTPSIHSTLFVPRLRARNVLGECIFGVRPMVAKLFLSASVKDAICEAGLSGLEFHEVELW